jgi:hypothetical protein
VQAPDDRKNALAETKVDGKLAARNYKRSSKLLDRIPANKSPIIGHEADSLSVATQLQLSRDERQCTHKLQNTPVQQYP